MTINKVHPLLIQIYTELLPDIRDTAKELGWAIAVHGSLTRDFDLVAVRWSDDSSDSDTLLHGIFDTLKLTKIRMEQCLNSKEIKHSGRTAYVIPLFADLYIDLSIID